LEKDWEARFAERHPARPTLFQVIRTKPAKIAAAYWIAVLLVFLGMQAAGFDMIASGAIPIAALTAPWSLLVIAATGSVSSAPSEALLRPFISTAGTFFIFPVLCGCLNAVLIFAVGSAIQRRRNRSR
jgi:hypothetical protein